MSSISPWTSFILALRAVLVAKLVIQGILSSISLIITLYISSLITSDFTTSLNLLKSTENGNNLSTSSLSNLLYKLLKAVETFFSLSISNPSTSDFKLAEWIFLAKDDALIPAAFFKSVFIAQLDRSNSNFTFPKNLVLENIHSFMICLFYQSNCQKTIISFPFHI